MSKTMLCHLHENKRKILNISNIYLCKFEASILWLPQIFLVYHSTILFYNSINNYEYTAEYIYLSLTRSYSNH